MYFKFMFKCTSSFRRREKISSKSATKSIEIIGRAMLKNISPKIAVRTPTWSSDSGGEDFSNNLKSFHNP